MASKVMASATTTHNSDPQNPTSQSSSLHHHHSLSSSSSPLGSMNMDDILKNIYSDQPDPDPFPNPGQTNKTVDEVWRDIVVAGGGRSSEHHPEMTLEDFLTKAGAVTEEDVRAPPQQTGFVVESMVAGYMQNGFGPGIEAQMGIGPGGPSGSGRGKRRSTVEELPLDKATQQKQRRMIKNRESAARSRERKQAYTVELESLVTQLEEENARLLKEEEQKNKERLKQIMENLIPVVEKRRPPRVLRRVRSMSW